MFFLFRMELKKKKKTVKNQRKASANVIFNIFLYVIIMVSPDPSKLNVRVWD